MLVYVNHRWLIDGLINENTLQLFTTELRVEALTFGSARNSETSAKHRDRHQ